MHEEDSTAPLREEEERREQLDVDDAADDDPCLLTSSYPSSQSLKLLRSPEASTDFEVFAQGRSNNHGVMESM